MAQRLSGAAVQLGVKSEEEVTMQQNFKQSQMIQNQANYENSPKHLLGNTQWVFFIEIFRFCEFGVRTRVRTVLMRFAAASIFAWFLQTVYKSISLFPPMSFLPCAMQSACIPLKMNLFTFVI